MRCGPFNLREFLVTDVARPALAVLSLMGKPQNDCHASTTFLCSTYAGADAWTDCAISRQCLAFIYKGFGTLRVSLLVENSSSPLRLLSLIWPAEIKDECVLMNVLCAIGSYCNLTLSDNNRFLTHYITVNVTLWETFIKCVKQADFELTDSITNYRWKSLNTSQRDKGLNNSDEELKSDLRWVSNALSVRMYSEVRSLPDTN